MERSARTRALASLGLMSYEMFSQDRKSIPCTLWRSFVYQKSELLRFRPDVLDRRVELDPVFIRSVCDFLIAKSYAGLTEAEIGPMVSAVLTNELLAGRLQFLTRLRSWNLLGLVLMIPRTPSAMSDDC